MRRFTMVPAVGEGEGEVRITPGGIAMMALLSTWEELVRLLGADGAEEVSLCLQHLRVAECVDDLTQFGFLAHPDPDRPDHARIVLEHGGVLVVRTDNGNQCGPKTSGLRVVSLERRHS